MSFTVTAWKKPGMWMAEFSFVLPDGRKWPEKRRGPGSRKVIIARTETIARREAEVHEAWLRAQQTRGATTVSASTVPTVATFAPEWLAKHAKANLHKLSGIDAQESIVKIHILPFIGSKRLDQVSDEVVADLRAKWIAGGYTYAIDGGKVRAVKGTSRRKTVNNRLSVLSMILKCAYEWKRIASVPCRIRLLKVDDQAEAEHYDHETYERLVTASASLDPRIHAAVLLGGDGGLRRGEILGLNLDDVDFKAGRLTVRRSVYWRKKTSHQDTVKGGRTKAIPSTVRLLDALKRCRHLRGPRLLYTDENTEVTPKILKAWIMRVEVKAGLPKTGRLHVYRHTFASHLAMAGVPAKTIQELCRHASLSITMRYMHLSPNATDEGIEMLSRSRLEGGRAVTSEIAPRAHKPV